MHSVFGKGMPQEQYEEFGEFMQTLNFLCVSVQPLAKERADSQGGPRRSPAKSDSGSHCGD